MKYESPQQCTLEATASRINNQIQTYEPIEWVELQWIYDRKQNANEIAENGDICAFHRFSK